MVKASAAAGYCDEQAIVMENLLDNAERALGNQPAPRLTVTIDRTEKIIAITVADNGDGIAPSDHERVFSPGFSSRSDGGLGLARSRDILQKWNGQIVLASSKIGQGSTFRISIPVSRVAPLDPMS